MPLRSIPESCEYGEGSEHGEHRTPDGICPGWRDFSGPPREVPAEPFKPTHWRETALAQQRELRAEEAAAAALEAATADAGDSTSDDVTAANLPPELAPRPRVDEYGIDLDTWRDVVPEVPLGDPVPLGWKRNGDGGLVPISANRKRFDWPEIKRRYVEGVKGSEQIVWPSLDEVAAHFNVGPTRVREKSAQEGWVTLRARFQQQVEATRQQARAAALAQRGTKVDTTALDAATVGLQLCLAALQAKAQEYQEARTAAGPGGSVKVRIDALEQTRLAQAVDLWHKIGMRAVGDPDARVEVTGKGGGPIEIAHELRRDDPTRMTQVLGVLQQAGLGELFGKDPAGAAALVRGSASDVRDEEV